MWPVLFTVPLLGFPVKSYGLMIAVGFLAGLWTAMRRAERHGIQPEAVSDLAVWVIFSGVVGARIFYVIQYWDEFAGKPLEILQIWHGGLVFYGGFLAALAGGFWFVRRRGLSPWEMGDLVAPSVLLGYAFGRVGCFLNGCCWGFPVDEGSVLGVRFPASNPLLQQWVPLGEERTIPLFPAQLASVLAGILLWAALDWRLARRRYAGQAFFWMLMGYPLCRFLIEFLRHDTARWAGPLGAFLPDFPGLTIAQWLSLPVFAGGYVWAGWVARRQGF